MMTGLAVETVHQFLQANLHQDAASVQWIGSGWFSHAFSFAVGEQAFIFRVNSYLEDLQKDAFAYQHFASARLPIPRVILLGPFDETRHFSITERCSGRALNNMDEATVRKIVPQLFETLDAIHGVDVSGYSGWGLTDANGNGRFDSWLSDGQTITGVLDWADCGLGDFVFDIAWLDFFSKEIPYGDLWRDYAAARGYAVPSFDERMRCYMLWIGLDSMASIAIKENERSYIRHRERTRSVLLPGRRSDNDWTQ